jgi:glucokinase
MLAAALDDQFRVLARKRRKTEGNVGADAGVARIVQTIQDVLAEAKLPVEQLAGIGLGIPGPLDLDRGVILETPNLGWSNVPIASRLRQAFGCPVWIANDVDAGVFGEYRFGAAVGVRCALGVFPGTGIGGGCVYEGRILRGKTGSCMEIGHLQVLPDGPLCGCGRRGCLESVASRLAISAAAAQAVYRGAAPTLHKIAGTDLANIRSGALAAAIEAGDVVVEQIVRQAAAHIGVAVAGAVNLLAPDLVVLGGGLVEAMPNLFVEEVQATARGRVMPALSGCFAVVAAKLGDDATALGAAAFAQQCVLAGNSKST